jgi:16S rRNA (uracil1498-N3)-methyltransferase
MGFPKADKFEHVVQKATELGAAEIVIFPCERSISRPDPKSLSKKLERWQKIAVSAAEQSGRGRIPTVLALDSFEAAVRRACATELPLLFYENERTRSLRAAAGERTFASAAIMTGPEGGLTPQEVQKAMDAGMQVCSLGPRILRCETAPLCALSALLYHTGDLD